MNVKLTKKTLSKSLAVSTIFPLPCATCDKNQCSCPATLVMFGPMFEAIEKTIDAKFDEFTKDCF